MDNLIRERAHAIWEREGRPDGRAEEHWRMAVAEIAAEQVRSEEPKRRSRKGAATAEAAGTAVEASAKPKRKPRAKPVAEVLDAVVDAAAAVALQVLKPKRQSAKGKAKAAEPATAEAEPVAAAAEPAAEAPKRRGRKAESAAEPDASKRQGRKAETKVWSPADITKAANGAKPKGRRKSGEPAASIH